MHLFFNRIKPPVLGKSWLIYWGKRAYNLPGLLRYIINIFVWRVKGASIGALSVIEADCPKGKLSNLTVGVGTSISRGVHFGLHEKITVGSNVVLNTNVRILTGNHNVRSADWELKARPVIVEDYAWIAEEAILLPGVTIGRGAVVGAGAVVRRNVEAYAIVIGNPATSIGTRGRSDFAYSPVRQVAYIEAWLGKSN